MAHSRCKRAETHGSFALCSLTGLSLNCIATCKWVKRVAATHESATQVFFRSHLCHSLPITRSRVGASYYFERLPSGLVHCDLVGRGWSNRFSLMWGKYGRWSWTAEIKSRCYTRIFVPDLFEKDCLAFQIPVNRASGRTVYYESLTLPILHGMMENNSDYLWGRNGTFKQSSTLSWGKVQHTQ